MNVYDTANKLAQEIKTSTEYVEYKKIKEEINSKSEIKSKINEFEKARYELQMLAMEGKEPDEEKKNVIQNLYVELIQNEEVKKYFDLELKFNVLLGDINKIIGEAVKDLIN